MALIEGGLTELIGVNEQVDASKYCGSIGVALSGGPLDTEIMAVALYSTEAGTGAVQQPAGKLLILDADPSVAVNDATLSAADFVTVLGRIDIAAEDWHADTTGALAYYTCAIPVHSLTNIYFVFFNEGSAFNDAAGDDEKLEFNFWYQDAP